MACLAMRGGVMNVGDLVTTCFSHASEAIGIVLRVHRHKNGAEVMVLFSNNVKVWLAQSELEALCK